MKTLTQNYNNCLVNLSNSILKHYGVTTYHNTLTEIDKYLEHDYKNVVLILYDGFGSKLIENNLGKESFFYKNKIKDITSVFPATTTAATTSITTGLTPAQHGWLGWDIYIESIDKTITMYWNVIKGTNINIADYNVSQKEFPYTTIFDLINEKGNAKAYCISPYEGVNYNEKNVDEMLLKIKELCKEEGKKFIYAYHNEPDNLMHELGVTDNKIIELMKSLDNKTKLLCNELEDTLIIVTADHGHITVSDYIILEDYKVIKDMLIRETSLELRAVNFFVKEDMLEDFKIEFNKLFSNDFILLTKQEVIDKKLFGDGIPNDKFYSCLGDYLAMATTNKAIMDEYISNPNKGLHAGITEDEVLVPLIIIDKK